MDEKAIAPPEGETASKDLRGVRGWLLFFCITLTVLNPVATIVIFGLSLAQLVPAFGRLPGLLILVAVDGVVSFGLMALSVNAGIALWRVRQNAVRTARLYLFAGVGYSLISPLFIFLVGLPVAAAAATLPASYLALGRTLLYYLLWLTYLRNSKRIQATFPIAPPAEQVVPAGD